MKHREVVTSCVTGRPCRDEGAEGCGDSPAERLIANQEDAPSASIPTATRDRLDRLRATWLRHLARVKGRTRR
jgi:hypothetical protein